jgi:hypothetical protein
MESGLPSAFCATTVRTRRHLRRLEDPSDHGFGPSGRQGVERDARVVGLLAEGRGVAEPVVRSITIGRAATASSRRCSISSNGEENQLLHAGRNFQK